MQILHSDLAATAPLRFGGNSAYAFDGDLVHLEAELLVAPPAASATAWSLQLWADAEGETAVKLAEVELGELVPDAAGRTHVSATTAAFPPAGNGEHRISLQLAARHDASTSVIDAVRYPRNERFVLPQFDGDVTQRIERDAIEVHVARILNPRAGNNLSGTLALELWALPAPYRGGAFCGNLLGTAIVGSLPGQADRCAIGLNAPVPSLANANHHLVLMLREWTAAGYLTRDYRNFGPALESTTAIDPATPADALPHTAMSRAAPGGVLDTAAAKPAAAAIPAEPAAAEKTGTRRMGGATKIEPSGPSINHASADELAQVKGLSLKLAKSIVAGRPWRSVDELLAVKGIGAKLLERIRGQVRC